MVSDILAVLLWSLKLAASLLMVELFVLSLLNAFFSCSLRFALLKAWIIAFVPLLTFGKFHKQLYETFANAPYHFNL